MDVPEVGLLEVSLGAGTPVSVGQQTVPPDTTSSKFAWANAILTKLVEKRGLGRDVGGGVANLCRTNKKNVGLGPLSPIQSYTPVSAFERGWETVER